MLPFGVIIPATVPQRSEIPEGLTNYPVFQIKVYIIKRSRFPHTFKRVKLVYYY
jgi:hypothetical protein